MRNTLKFMHEGRCIYLNVDSIATIEQHKYDHDKSLIILVNGTSYKIDIPVEKIFLKICRIIDESLFINKSILKVL